LSVNALELVQVLQRLKPSAAKGTYFRSIYMSSTMSPSVSIDIKSIPGL
jgi:large subunit ribosomal protein L1